MPEKQALSASPTWARRWGALRAAGLTRDQALGVYHLIEEIRGHHTATLAAKSLAALEATYDEREDDDVETAGPVTLGFEA